VTAASTTDDVDVTPICNTYVSFHDGSGALSFLLYYWRFSARRVGGGGRMEYGAVALHNVNWRMSLVERLKMYDQMCS
jgi:hypothetical protein